LLPPFEKARCARPASHLTGQVRQQIEESLSVMEQIGKNSLITQKAGCCIERMLAVVDTLGAYEGA
jgi:hypothetical protein